MSISIQGRRALPLVGGLLILAGAFVGSLEGSSGVPVWTFVLGLAVVLYAIRPLLSRGPFDKLRAAGFAGIGWLIAALGTLTAAELGGDVVAHLMVLALVSAGTLVVLASSPVSSNSGIQAELKSHPTGAFE